MRLKLALIALSALGAAGAIASPASAQAYYGPDCAHVKANNTAGGAILGAIIGGALGSNIAARGHRGDGTAVGAGVGALVGGAAGNSTQCAAPPPPPYPVSEPYPPGPPPSDLAGGPPPDRYSDGGYDYRSPPPPPRHRHRYDVDGNDTSAYQDSYAGRDCTTVQQVTHLPDGSSVSKPVDVCREARYGSWEVQN